MMANTEDPRDQAMQEIESFLDEIDREAIPQAWSDIGHRATIRDCLESAQRALDARDPATLARFLEELLELSAALGFGELDRCQEEIGNWIDILSITESRQLFEAK